jgi:hypothetical protein
MKLAHIALVAVCMVGGYSYAQTAQQEDRAVARACKADAEKMCSGKTGQAMEQCLKSNQAQLSSNCKEAVSKLPAQPK